MRLGISRPTQGPDDTRAMLTLASEFAFEGVQFKPNQYASLEGGMTPASFSQVYQGLARLACGGLIVYCPPDLDGWKDCVLPVLDFAREIGSGQVCLCGGIRRQEGGPPAHREAAAILNDLGGAGRAQNVRLSLHNHARSIFETRRDILRMAELLEPDRCGLTFDTAHYAKGGGEEPAALLREIRPHLINVHLKDLDERGKFCPLGTGRLELEPVLEVLGETGYDQWLVVDEESMDVPTDLAFARSRKYLNAFLRHE